MCSMTNQMLNLLKGTESFHKVQILDSLISLFNADDLVSKVILVLQTEYIQKLDGNIIRIVSNWRMRNIKILFLTMGCLWNLHNENVFCFMRTLKFKYYMYTNWKSIFYTPRKKKKLWQKLVFIIFWEQERLLDMKHERNCGE
jgi:hypothetical protein